MIPEKAKTLLLIMLLLIMMLLFFQNVIFSGKTFIARDNYMFYNPRRFFAAETIRSGTLPLWNPYLACGVPFQANLQSSLCYPLSALYYLMPFQTGFKYFIIMHYFLGGLFMFGLMRQWDSSRFAALFASVVFTFGGYMASINDNVAFATAGAWLPLIVMLHHRALQSGRFFYSLACAMAICLQVFAGDASFYLLSSLMCTVLYTLYWQAFLQRAARTAFWRPWTQLLLSWAAGALLAAIQLVPFAEFVSRSTRFAGLSYDTITKSSFHPLELLQLLSPYIFGTTVPNTRWFGQQWLDTVYSGVFPLALAALFLCCSRQKIRFFLLTLVAVSLFLAFGKYNPAFPLLYRNLPITGMMLFPVKYLFITSFALAVMAGKGASCLVDMSASGRNVARVGACTMVVLLALVALLGGAALRSQDIFRLFSDAYPDLAYMQQFKDRMFLNMFSGVATTAGLLGLFLAVLWTGVRFPYGKTLVPALLICITFADLVFIGKPPDPVVEESIFREDNTSVDFLRQDDSVYRIYTPRTITGESFLHLYNVPFEQTYRALQKTQLANLNMYHAVETAEEYAALMDKNFSDLINPVRSFFMEGNPLGTDAGFCKHILSLLNVKYIISRRNLQGMQVQLVRDGRIKIYRNNVALPRAFFVPRLHVVANEQQVLAAMRRPDFMPARTAYTTRIEAAKLSPLALPAPSSHAAPADGAVITSRGPNMLRLAVKTARPGFLLVANKYYPGWKAFIDGKKVPIVRVDHMLQGVTVQAGTHDVLLAFRPVSLALGAVLSITAWALTIAGLVVLKHRGGAFIHHDTPA